MTAEAELVRALNTLTWPGAFAAVGIALAGAYVFGVLIRRIL